MMTVKICVGSSCHIKGARQMVASFEELVKKHNLGDKVELKGSFCMERCGDGMNWQIDDEQVTSRSVEEAVSVFMRRVVKQ